MTAVPRSGTVAPLVGSEGRGGGVLRRGELVADQAGGRDGRPALLPPLLDHPDGEVVEQGGALGRELLRVEEVRVEAEVGSVVGGGGGQGQGWGGRCWA